MKRTRTAQLVALICLVLALAPGAFAGTYQDRDGGKHPWSVDEAHALVWDGSPYMPFGIVFKPRYLSAAQTEENLAADKADLESFVLAGIQDIIIRPGRAVSTIPVEAWQQIVDLLESSGIRYGIELDDSPYSPLTGYVIDPAANRISGIKGPGEVSRDLPNAGSAFYALCDTRTSAVVDSGKTPLEGGSIRVHARAEPGIEHVMLIYPHKVIAPGPPDWSIPELWGEADRHRDRLASFLLKIRFGKGLRFFTDPFGEQMSLRGEAAHLIPTSPGFRLEYAAWLSRKYRSISDLKVGWALLSHEIASFDEAVRLIPMWRYGRGLSAVYDDKTGRRHDVDVRNTAIWSDLVEFRNESVRGYMDGLADAVKLTCANVPVVFSAGELQPFFQASSPVGFDGLCVPALGFQAARNQGGAVYSLAEHSARRIWMVSRIGGAGETFEKKDQLFGYINGLRDLGAKAFFVDDSAIPQKASGADVMLWLAEYGKSAQSDKQFVGFRPRALYYPQGTANASMKRLAGGAWWLPSLLPGKSLFLGGKFSGFVLPTPSGAYDLYIWCPAGPAAMRVPATQTAIVVRPSGERIEVKPKKDRVELPITDEPSLIIGVPPETFLPVEAVEEALGKLLGVIAQAEAKGLDVSSYKDTVKQVEHMTRNNSLFIALDVANVALAELTQRMQGLQNDPNTRGQAPAQP